MQHKKMEEQLQRTSQWYEARLYKFTASEFHKLMSGGRRDMTPEELAIEKANGGKRKTVDTMFGDTAIKYIVDKVAEIITNGTILDYKKVDAKALEWGVTWEHEAKTTYALRTGNPIQDCGFFEYNEMLGASPDGLILEDGIAEVKCPYDTAHHIENLRLKAEEEFYNLRYEYYIQIQVQLLSTGRKWCDFISYDPRCSPHLRIKILRVPRNEEIINEIKIRVVEAKKILDSIVMELSDIAKQTQIFKL
jgi:hypothetical protein